MARVTGLIARIVASLAGLGSAILGINALVHAAGIHHTLNPNPDSPALEGVLAVYFWLTFIATIRCQPVWSLVPGWLARAYLMRKKSGLERWPAPR